jgi:predicted DsbA family dithiol-disulfide isomerase
VLPNTLDAHRLIQFAAMGGVQDSVVEGLMKAYFEEGVDLSNRKNLLDVAAKAGLDRQAASRLLQSDADVPAVRQMENLNQERGISGVPFFIINDKYGISGAQPKETFIQVLMEVAAENVERV